MAERTKSERRGPLVEWRRLPKRVLLLINFCLGAMVMFLVLVPFNAGASDGVTTLRCGPPLFEVVVPVDEAFDVPENGGCLPPARSRVILGGAVFGGLLVVTVATQARSGRSTRARQAIWLAGGRRKATKLARRTSAPPSRRPTSSG